ncbi:type II toxin-antitoxin system VapC family toxin [Angustibacter speluncae]
MIVDSSALMAIVNEEPDGGACLRLAAASPTRMSVASWVEVGIVADARSASHARRLDEIISELEIETVPVSRQHAQVARAAYQRFGRGSGSPARLNFGDCFSYALSVVTGEPLLFVGDDFARTDVQSALR